MAEQKDAYPTLGSNTWWALRKKFKRSMPNSVTRNYLSTVLNVSDKTAQNILPVLKKLGLIDQEGNTGTRANHWRVDEEYAQVCEEIRKEIYPQELLDAVPDPLSNFDGATRWFMRRSGVGEASAKAMAKFYQLLSDGDPSKEQQASESYAVKKTSKTENSPKILTKPKATANSEGDYVEPLIKKPKQLTSDPIPSVHIDIQIHISSDASPDQIDQIFASMARHLYKRGSAKNEQSS